MSNDFVWGTDTYRAFALLLDSNGAPAAPGYPAAEDPYEGLEIEGVQDFVPNWPAPRSVVGIAQGRVRDTIFLPSLEAQTAVMHTLYDVLQNNATLQGVLLSQEGGRKTVPYNTDKQGLEPDVALIASRLVTHNQDGITVWNHLIIPRARMIPSLAVMNQNASQYTYNISISKTKSRLWGKPLSIVDNGVLEMGLEDVVGDDRMNIIAWKADGYEDTFLLPTNKPAAASYAITMKVYDHTAGGTPVSGTPGTTQFVAGSPPTAGHILVAVYEY